LQVIEENVMPVYEYLCRDCGPFTQIRSMSEYELPFDCPKCEASAPRVILTAPHCSAVSTQSRIAHATNERSADRPRTLSSMRDSHGAGCSCCSGRSSRLLKRGKGGTKSFPSSRPWMISH
jgi:putative FmdB family regulatory protein